MLNLINKLLFFKFLIFCDFFISCREKFLKKTLTRDEDETKKKAKSERKKEGKPKDGDGWETVKKGSVIPTVSRIPCSQALGMWDLNKKDSVIPAFSRIPCSQALVMWDLNNKISMYIFHLLCSTPQE